MTKTKVEGNLVQNLRYSQALPLLILILRKSLDMFLVLPKGNFRLILTKPNQFKVANIWGWFNFKLTICKNFNEFVADVLAG